MRKEDFADHGYTANCPGCGSILLKRHYHQRHSEECRRRVEDCLKDEERMKTARQRMTEYAAERIRHEDQKRLRKEVRFKEEEPTKLEEGIEVNEPSSSSSSSGSLKRNRDPSDVLEKEDLLEEGQREESTRGVKRAIVDEESDEARRRRLELEQGATRTAEDEGETPEATKQRIFMVDQDELHEPEFSWNEWDYDTVT